MFYPLISLSSYLINLISFFLHYKVRGALYGSTHYVVVFGFHTSFFLESGGIYALFYGFVVTNP
jgi:hypothetical protein